MTEQDLLVERDRVRAIEDAFKAKKWDFIEQRKARGELPPGFSCGCGDCWSAYIDAKEQREVEYNA